MRAATLLLLFTAQKAAADDFLASAQRVIDEIRATEGGFVAEGQELQLLGPGYRGVVATANFSQGDVLAVIPWALCIAGARGGVARMPRRASRRRPRASRVSRRARPQRNTAPRRRRAAAPPHRT